MSWELSGALKPDHDQRFCSALFLLRLHRTGVVPPFLYIARCVLAAVYIAFTFTYLQFFLTKCNLGKLKKMPGKGKHYLKKKKSVFNDTRHQTQAGENLVIV